MPLKIAVHKGAKNTNLIRNYLSNQKPIFLVLVINMAVNDFSKIIKNVSGSNLSLSFCYPKKTSGSRTEFSEKTSLKTKKWSLKMG